MQRDTINVKAVYRQWKALRGNPNIPDGFAERVMDRIRHLNGGWLNEEMGELVWPARWPAKVALAGGLLTLGLFRFLFILANLVFP